jgi:Xaa-Pro aminopeptidase
MSPGPEILFIKPADPSRANWDALTLGIEGAKKKGGFADVRPSGEFDEYFGKILLSDPVILYIDYEKTEKLNDPLTADEQLFNKAREKGAVFKIQSPSILLNTMLANKSPAEIEILKKAINITAEAQKEAMRSIQPGMYEYQLQTIIRFVYRMNGAPGIGFPCIIGSGINSVVLHWMENSGKMEDGDIVVVDIGAEYGMYWADITRTIPVNGKYSKRQKEIYEIVLKANEEAIKMVAPGVDFADISKKADEILADGMQKIGLIKEKSEFKKYYYHGLGHHIGIINARGDRLGKLEPGMVITIEPGIYIREEKLGVRIEDDVLVTETGYDVLTKKVPKKIEDIEKLMGEKGMDYEKNLIIF